MKTALVVTSIAAPNAALSELAAGAAAHAIDFIVIGDEKSPGNFALANCRFFGVDAQRRLPFRLARSAPTRSYARKNIGYLVALDAGAEVVLETDDDNFPLPAFWMPRVRRRKVARIAEAGWVNVYRYFTGANIWPRGLPLDAAAAPVPAAGPAEERDCPIQQGLANDNPDVDAIYRLLLPLPQSFQDGVTVSLGRGAWSPFNSQSTAFFREAAPLLYLPSFCSFRMTDIWRSFVAQRIAWANGWSILFHGPDVRQERNEHDLMRDFRDEVPGYLHNRAIGAALDELEIAGGTSAIGEGMRQCYRAMIALGVVDARELPLLEDWLADIGALAGRS
ncbi:MAG TPA: STELLO glycosyltransferase family protein [Bauldia sp.]|nr:STELLO glycosyltransferase family protein [Bauldia sp.]